MSEFNFKSQICTNREQSERLLALGLKPETADCVLIPSCDWDGTDVIRVGAMHLERHRSIPAWGLHRLIEMMPEEMYGGLLCIFKDSIRYEEAIMDRLEAHFEAVGDNMYDNAISCIEWLIKEGYFPKEYLNGTTED